MLGDRPDAVAGGEQLVDHGVVFASALRKRPVQGCSNSLDAVGRLCVIRRGHREGPEVRHRTPDGAKTFRFYLQHKASAARRLNFWELPDGVLELANVADHDDMVIR
jgi:hypothetical protein